MTVTTKTTARRDRIERMVKLGHIEIRKFADYCKLPGGEWGYATTVENGGSGSYGDFSGEHDLAEFDDLADDDDFYVFCKYTGYSDYSGSTVEASNCKELKEQFDSIIIDVYGGHGTTDVCFSLRWLLTDCDENDDEADSTADLVLDIFEGLEDYPLINDEALSTLEMESSDEAWDCWVYSDFVKEVESKLGVELDGHDKDSMRTVFEKCAESANEYWFNEGSGTDMYIRVSEVVAEVTVDMVAEWIVPVVLVVRDEKFAPIVVIELKGSEWTSNMSLYDDIAELAVEAYLDDCTDFAVGEGGAQYSVSAE